MFDCGALVQGWKPRILFLTHTHTDHAHFLPHIKNADRPPLIYLPKEAEPFAKAFVKAHQEMGDCMTEAESQQGGTYQIDHIMRPTEPGEEISFSQGGKEFIVRTLKMDHRVPCLGYSIFKLKKSLKQEFVGKPGREIGRLRKEGVEVNDTREEPFLCFLGDTTAAVFASHPEILRQHRVIVVECSFIDEGSVKRAETTKHMHWNDLEPHIEDHPDIYFVLIHFSLKYSTLSLRKFFCEKQRKYQNFHPMISDEEVEEHWKKADSANAEDMPRCRCKLCFH
jgi:ribonuclease Z